MHKPIQLTMAVLGTSVMMFLSGQAGVAQVPSVQDLLIPKAPVQTAKPVTTPVTPTPAVTQPLTQSMPQQPAPSTVVQQSTPASSATPTPVTTTTTTSTTSTQATTAPPVSASTVQTTNIPSPTFVETMPIEVALVYYKLLKEEPNLDFLVFANPAFRKDPEKFSDSEAVAGQRAALEKIYKSITPQTVLFVEKNLDVQLPVDQPGTIKLKGLEPYEPIVYDITDSERYGIFVRNARKTMAMTPPFIQDASSVLSGMQPAQLKNLPVEITLRPLTVDREDYTMNDDGQVKVIIADVVEVKVFDADKKIVLLQKRFENWQPSAPPVPETVFSSDTLLPAPATP